MWDKVALVVALFIKLLYLLLQGRFLLSLQVQLDQLQQPVVHQASQSEEPGTSQRVVRAEAHFQGDAFVQHLAPLVELANMPMVARAEMVQVT
jgi:hypothetical protein